MPMVGCEHHIATLHHIGKFELARKGTPFLDEIGDMPKTMQAKMLRVPPMK